MMASIAETRRPVLHGLTGLRFIAATMVLLFHFGAGFAGRSGVPGPIVLFLQHGYLGVSLFFMLSGFIITYSYDGRLGTRAALWDYAVARFSRIYPVYLLALAMALPFAWSALTPARVAVVLGMLQTWTVPASSSGYAWLMQAWTLSVELFFYLCAPLILRALRGAGDRGLLALALVSAAAMIALWTPSVPPGTLVFPFAWEAWVPIPVLRMAEFLLGVALCKLMLRQPGRAVEIAHPVLTGLNILAIAIVLATARHPAITSAAMVLTGLLLVQIAARETLESRFLASRAMLLLGASSYALYLIQAPVREYLRLLPVPGLAQVLNPIVAVALSVLIFRLWEEPARRWLRRRLAFGSASAGAPIPSASPG